MPMSGSGANNDWMLSIHSMVNFVGFESVPDVVEVVSEFDF